MTGDGFDPRGRFGDRLRDHSRPVVLGVTLVLASAFLLSACVKPISPARTFDAYEHKAKDTAEAVLSAVGTARLVAQAASDGDAFGPYASVALSEAEEGAGHAQTVFESVQPPDDHSDRVRRRLTRLLDKAADGLSTLRIAARRGELHRLNRLAAPLRGLAKRLDAFVTRHE